MLEVNTIIAAKNKGEPMTRIQKLRFVFNFTPDALKGLRLQWIEAEDRIPADRDKDHAGNNDHAKNGEADGRL